MSDQGEDMSKWLRRVVPHQNMEDLAQLDDVTIEGLRRWFLSQVIQPTVNLGYYDNNTGKYVLGPGNINDIKHQTTMVLNNAGAGLTSYTLGPVPAGELWIVLCPTVGNGNRASSWHIEATDGTTTSSIGLMGAGVASNERVNLFGVGGDPATNGCTVSVLTHYPLPAGWSLVIDNVNFVAGDATIYEIHYLRVIL